jgi:hypothetical protein
MSTAARVFLLLSASCCAGFIGMAGIGFALMADPQKTDARTFIFWTVVALVFAAPMWIPALIPDRHPFALKIGRWVGALALLLPIALFAKMTSEQLHQGGLAVLLSWQPTFLMALALMAICMIALVLLTRPDTWLRGRRRAVDAR